MGHLYEAQGSDGKKYDVETPNHHEDHHSETFANHLLDIIKSTISGVLTHKIVNQTSTYTELGASTALPSMKLN